MNITPGGTGSSKGLTYYTVYLRGLANGTGYVDLALSDDQLFKDFLQYLDVGIKPVRTYAIALPPKADGRPVAQSGQFAVNFSEVIAITTVKPA